MKIAKFSKELPNKNKHKPPALERSSRMYVFVCNCLNLPAPPFSMERLPLFIKYISAKTVSFEELTEIILHLWKKAYPSEVREVVEMLEANGMLKSLRGDRNHSRDVWTVVRPPKPKASPLPSPKPSSLPRWLRKTLKYRKHRSEGTCPRCGENVLSSRRHANEVHTPQDCKTFQVNKILDM